VPVQGERLVYESGEWEVDLTRRELRAHGLLVPIGGRAFEILEVLVQSAGELVIKRDLMDRVWPGAIVEDNTLQFHISAIRKALGPDRGMLKTASGRGYRLVGGWVLRQENTSSAEAIDLEPVRSTAEPFQTNVPAAAFELVGRSIAVQHLHDLLSAYRVVTLTGPGGIGKTRLAFEVARGLFPNFQGDVRLVELVSVSDPALAPSAVTAALGLELGGDQISAESVARAVGAKRLLLVLDNCEHVIDAAAKLAETIVEALAGAGRIAQGLAAIDEALAQSERNEERWCVPEFLRIKGELILREGSPQAAKGAEQHFRHSIDWARQQGVLLWELRTSTSLARLQQDQHRIAEARSLLQSAYNRFSEGFETADLKTANALLNSLQ
jgi:DNA-binding winged helix-turn-helix (wHTH) protein